MCNNSENNQLHDATEMMLGLGDTHQYMECSACGCLQIVTVPENLPSYYPDDNYYSYDNIQSLSGLKKFLVTKRDHYAATGSFGLGKIIHQFLPHSKIQTLQKTGITTSSRVLDVGCGAGHLLHSLQEAGFNQLLGVDPFNAEDIQYDNGLIIEKKSLHEVEQGAWDLIMFHHSFEHVFDQQETLVKAASLLKSGGVCLVRVPTSSSWAWQHYGVDWVQLDAPRHLFLHSIESMTLLAEKVGLTMDAVVYDSFAFQLWGSEQYLKGIPLNDATSYAVNPDKSAFSKQDIAEFEQRSIALNQDNQGDQAAFYLKKP
ncbi:MAG: class I SAM-dependent methyltransferase [Cocleimonas sp.]|nr:class I SAM-dependent methyltransferase [Cocleimonas sp.]